MFRIERWLKCAMLGRNIQIIEYVVCLKYCRKIPFSLTYNKHVMVHELNVSLVVIQTWLKQALHQFHWWLGPYDIFITKGTKLLTNCEIKHSKTFDLIQIWNNMYNNNRVESKRTRSVRLFRRRHSCITSACRWRLRQSVVTPLHQRSICLGVRCSVGHLFYSIKEEGTKGQIYLTVKISNQ